ncbi:MAG: PGN_0703 family putative restriction endonuclease [Acidobacteriota bacterium]
MVSMAGVLPNGTLACVSRLRAQLSECSQKYAQVRRLAHQLSYGGVPAVVFEASGDGQHGNFLPASYRAILKNPEWSRRLAKPHSQSKCLPRTGRRWCELDSCNSSDALLMNVFCYPGVASERQVLHLLGAETDGPPQFGYKARVPLLQGKFDRTEVDMRLGNLLVEAKLTEGDFQTKSKAALAGYRDFSGVFRRRQLPQHLNHYFSYQLIRNVLAANATGFSFCVLSDARRPDLLEAWFQVMQAVRPTELRVRCKVLTWQELAIVLPQKLQRFLQEKYAIFAAS